MFDVTPKNKRKGVLFYLKKISIGVMFSAFGAFITLLTALRFDTHEIRDIDFSMCYADRDNIPKLMRTISQDHHSWHFYNIEINTSCEEHTKIYLSWHQRRKKSKVRTEVDGNTIILLEDHYYVEAPGNYKYRTVTRKHTDKDIVYHFDPSFLRFNNPDDNYLINSPGATIEIKLAEGSEYVYSSVDLNMEGSADRLTGPFAVQVLSDGEQSKRYLLTPLPRSPEIDRANACNKLMSNWEAPANLMIFQPYLIKLEDVLWKIRGRFCALLIS